MDHFPRDPKDRWGDDEWLTDTPKRIERDENISHIPNIVDISAFLKAFEDVMQTSEIEGPHMKHFDNFEGRSKRKMAVFIQDSHKQQEFVDVIPALAPEKAPEEAPKDTARAALSS